jgi:gamma-glutamyl-gamma-aminobutyrate hydrolase PuuD
VRSHANGAHAINTGENSVSRTILGRRTEVVSEHHQGVRRLGRGVRVTSLSSDGVVEMVEVPSRRFVLGLQWHPERSDVAEAGGRVADALVSAARTSPTRLARAA